MDRPDLWPIRLALAVLGLVVLVVVTGAIILTFYGRTLPGEVTHLGATALGALGSFFVSSYRPTGPASDAPPIPVEIVQPAGETVPVTETKGK